MPVAYLNKGVRKDGLSEANERSEEQSEGVRVSAASDSETKERTPLSPP